MEIGDKINYTPPGILKSDHVPLRNVKIIKVAGPDMIFVTKMIVTEPDGGNGWMPANACEIISKQYSPRSKYVSR